MEPDKRSSKDCCPLSGAPFRFHVGGFHKQGGLKSTLIYYDPYDRDSQKGPNSSFPQSRMQVALQSLPGQLTEAFVEIQCDLLLDVLVIPWMALNFVGPS